MVITAHDAVKNSALRNFRLRALVPQTTLRTYMTFNKLVVCHHNHFSQGNQSSHTAINSLLTPRDLIHVQH